MRSLIAGIHTDSLYLVYGPIDRIKSIANPHPVQRGRKADFRRSTAEARCRSPARPAIKVSKDVLAHGAAASLHYLGSVTNDALWYLRRPQGVLVFLWLLASVVAKVIHSAIEPVCWMPVIFRPKASTGSTRGSTVHCISESISYSRQLVLTDPVSDDHRVFRRLMAIHATEMYRRPCSRSHACEARRSRRAPIPTS